MPNAVSRRQTGVKSIKRHNRVAPKGLAFGMLEPCAFNGARTVLRGLGDGDIPGYSTQNIGYNWIAVATK